MSDERRIKTGDRALVFDAIAWQMVGHDVGDNSQFWMPATITRVYRYDGKYSAGEWVVDVVFDHRSTQVSHAHFISAIKTVESMS